MKPKNTMMSPRPKLGPIYWMRFSLAIFSALLCAFLRLGIEGLIIGIVIYLVSYLAARYLLKTNGNLRTHASYLSGIGTYFITWFTFWTLLHTLQVSFSL